MPNLPLRPLVILNLNFYLKILSKIYYSILIISIGLKKFKTNSKYSTKKQIKNSIHLKKGKNNKIDKSIGLTNIYNVKHFFEN